jgi:hypothetical protein
VTLLSVRDFPDEIAASIDAAQKAAGARSREAFLRDHLKRVFGPNGSVTAAISARVRAAVEYFETLGRFLVLRPAPTIPLIARALGHPDPSVLEAILRGDVPLSFADGDRLCTLFGLDRTWLESGGAATPQFSTMAIHSDSHRLLREFLVNGIPYENLFFVLTEGEQSVGAIIGQTTSDDPTVGWRYDLLLCDIPIHTHVGGTGRAQRREFADLMVALYHDEWFVGTPLLIGVVAPYRQYMAMISGHLHPATITNTYAPGAANAMSRPSDWPHDFWTFNQHMYTPEYARAHEALLSELRKAKITTNEQYFAAVEKMVGTWKMKRKAEATA